MEDISPTLKPGSRRPLSWLDFLLRCSTCSVHCNGSWVWTWTWQLQVKRISHLKRKRCLFSEKQAFSTFIKNKLPRQQGNYIPCGKNLLSIFKKKKRYPRCKQMGINIVKVQVKSQPPQWEKLWSVNHILNTPNNRKLQHFFFLAYGRLSALTETRPFFITTRRWKTHMNHYVYIIAYWPCVVGDKIHFISESNMRRLFSLYFTLHKRLCCPILYTG